MPTRQNRYFNDPNMAAAFSNLAGLFAPPSAQDFYAMSRTEGQDFQNQATRQAWEAMSAEGVTPQTQDRFGIAATLFGQGFNPTQSHRAVDIASADRRYGVDVGARTALATNAADNERRLRETAFGARTNPSGVQGISDADIAATLGIDVPGFGAMQPVAPTDEQVLGANRQRLLDEIPGLAEALAADGISASNVVTPDGVRMMPTGRAAVQGMEPHINAGQPPAPQRVSYRTPDGRSGTAVFNPADQSLRDIATGETLPEGTLTGNIQDTAEGLGGTSTMINRETERFTSAGQALDVIADLRDRLRANPGAVGVAGGLQRLAQNLVATVDEFSQAFGGRTPTFNELVDNGAAQVFDDSGRDLTRVYFNPALPEIQFMKNQVIWAFVSAQQGSGRVSNQQLEEARAYLGADQWLSNNRAFDAALNIMERDLQRVQMRAEATGMVPRTMIDAYRAGRSVGPTGAPQEMGAPARPRAVNEQTGQVVEWDGQAWVPVQ